MLHSYFWIFLSWFMHALFTSCSPVLAQHASSKFDVPLMTPGGCGQWVQACRLSGRVSEWWKPCDMTETPSHQAPQAEPLPRSNSISPHLTTCHGIPGRATSRFMQAWRRLFCFGFRASVRWMLWYGIPWHPVASRLPGPKLDLGGKRKARKNSHYRCCRCPKNKQSLLVTTYQLYHLNETDISWL